MASQTSPMVAQSGEVGTDPAERSKPKASGRIHSVIGTVIHHETAQGGQGKLVRRSTQYACAGVNRHHRHPHQARPTRW